MSDKPTKLELVNDAISDDPFDLEKLRINPDVLETTNVKKLLTTVPIRKPNQQDFVRTHPSPAYREMMAVLDLKEDREIYVVARNALPELQSECFTVTLFTAITRSGVLFLWPVRVPAADSKKSEWHTSAATAAQHAMTHWVRVRANMRLGAYEIFLAESSIPDPIFPDLTFQEIMRIALRERLITSSDHPAAKQLRGG